MSNQQNRGSVLRMIHTLEICSTALKNDEASPLLGMASKALAQLQSHSDTVTAEAVDWKDKYEQMGQLNDELVEKNDTLHQSLEEATKIATGMSEKMTGFGQAHEVSVKGYEENLASLDEKLNQAELSKEECSTALYALKEENEVLTTQFKEDENYFEQDLMELGAEKALQEEIKVLRAELEEAKDAEDYYNRELAGVDAEKEAAYHNCEVLQQEIDLLNEASDALGLQQEIDFLRKALEESEMGYDVIQSPFE